MVDKQSKKRLDFSQKVVMLIAAVIFITGIGFLTFPMISNFFAQQKADGIIDDFNESLDNIVSKDGSSDNITSKTYLEALGKGEIDKEGYAIDSSGRRISDFSLIFEYDLDTLYRDSEAYNKSLIDHQGTIDTTNYEQAALKMSKYGLNNFYCYLDIPGINLYLPVYLGANDSMMSCGAAHLSGTSLPIDMKNTNVALAGHTGYIGRIFFDNIRKLNTGDTVTIHNYWENIDYKVIDFKIVKSDQTADIFIQKDRQLLTLITCIKNKNKGFDRYLVICEKK